MTDTETPENAKIKERRSNSDRRKQDVKPDRREITRHYSR